MPVPASTSSGGRCECTRVTLEVVEEAEEAGAGEVKTADDITCSNVRYRGKEKGGKKAPRLRVPPCKIFGKKAYPSMCHCSHL